LLSPELNGRDDSGGDESVDGATRVAEPFGHLVDTEKIPTVIYH
jgi:hypothetical protein